MIGNRIGSFVAVGFVTLCVSLPAEAARLRVAVLDLRASEVRVPLSQAVSELIRVELVKIGVYDFLNRNSMTEVLKEQAFQLSDCTTSECAVEVGKLMNCREMFVGELAEDGKAGFQISMQCVDVETTKVEFVVKMTAANEDLLPKTARNLAQELVRRHHWHYYDLAADKCFREGLEGGRLFKIAATLAMRQDEKWVCLQRALMCEEGAARTAGDYETVAVLKKRRQQLQRSMQRERERIQPRTQSQAMQDKVKEAEEARDYILAIRLLEQALESAESEPDRQRIKERLALNKIQIALTKSDYETASSMYRELAQRHAGQFNEQHYLLQAELVTAAGLIAAGDYETACGIYQRLADESDEFESTSGQNYYQRAHFLYMERMTRGRSKAAANDYKGAMKCFQDASLLMPNDIAQEEAEKMIAEMKIRIYQGK